MSGRHSHGEAVGNVGNEHILDKFLDHKKVIGQPIWQPHLFPQGTVGKTEKSVGSQEFSRSTRSSTKVVEACQEMLSNMSWDIAPTQLSFSAEQGHGGVVKKLQDTHTGLQKVVQAHAWHMALQDQPHLSLCGSTSSKSSHHWPTGLRKVQAKACTTHGGPP